MEVILNGRFGGTDDIDQLFRPLIIELRKRINKSFLNANLNTSLRIQYFILVNGDIVQYYNKSGIYKTQFFQKKHEISLELCIADILTPISYNQALKVLNELFVLSIDKISQIEQRKKENFLVDEVRELFECIFNDMMISLIKMKG